MSAPDDVHMSAATVESEALAHPLCVWLRQVHELADQAADLFHAYGCAALREEACDCGNPVQDRARITAERALLARHTAYPSWRILYDDNLDEIGEATDPYCITCAQGESCDCCLDDKDRVWPCQEWRIIAQGWSHWGGYQAEWAPITPG